MVMEENDELLLVELLEDILGEKRSYYPHKGQVSFDCHWCGEDGVGKGNLEVNVFKNVYKCWACGDVNNTHGPLLKLVNILGDKKQIRMYHMLKPEDSEKYSQDVEFKKVELPKEFIPFFKMNKYYPPHLSALRYIRDRNITNDMIRKYNIGFCDSGKYSNRIIIPSYDINGDLNYFIGRSWISGVKLKYLNPDVPKDTIIFNESLIDWSKDIFIVEGVFDSLFLDNSIPLLGKTISEKLFDMLYERAQGSITLCLDGDAIANSTKLYHELNGGKLYGRIKMVKLPLDKDVAELKGDINDYYFEVR